MNCIFCLASAVAGKKIRRRSPKNIVDELELCVDKFNIRNFFLRADTFTWDKIWVKDVCQEIIKRNLKINWVSTTRVDKIDKERLLWMKNAGCWLIAFGIESGDQEILDKIKKGSTLEQAEGAVRLCKKIGIKTLLHSLIGFPWEDRDKILKTVKFLKKLDGDFFELRFCIPYPGTELERIERELGLLPDRVINECDFYEYQPKTLYLNEEELAKIRKQAILKILLRPTYIIKRFTTINSLTEYRNYISFGIKKFINILKR